MTPTVAVLGGGQLARMLALAAIPLGVRVRALDPSPEAGAAAAADLVVAAYDDPQGLDRLAHGADVATFEFENPPAASAERLAARVPVRPPAGALAAAQDRLVEKELLAGLGIAVPAFAPVDDAASLERALDHCGLPAVLKTRREGYDGRGQRVLRGAEEAEPAREALGGSGLILEAFVHFDRELSVLAVRGVDGQAAAWPVVQNEHAEGILRVSQAPAADPPAGAAEAALALAETLGYVGVLALELFDVGGRLLANEFAPRVHNSGHWTIEGAETSQFENHLRAVLGWPLGSTAVRAPSAMVNLVGDVPELSHLLAISGAHVHLYGKAPRPGRKLGHVTLVGDAVARLPEVRALAAGVAG